MHFYNNTTLSNKNGHKTLKKKFQLFYLPLVFVNNIQPY